jgi:hypothetical protein
MASIYGTSRLRRDTHSKYSQEDIAVFDLISKCLCFNGIRQPKMVVSAWFTE